MWRGLNRRHKNITYSFLIVGHTKFSPDTYFGLIKQRYRKTFVGCLEDVATVVSQSSVVNEVQLVGMDNGTSIVPMFDWVKFLDPLTRRIKGTKKFQHFRFSSDHPGKVFARVTHDGPETTFTLIRRNCEDQLKRGFPDIIPPPRLSPERQQYLYEKICKFCPEEVYLVYINFLKIPIAKNVINITLQFKYFTLQTSLFCYWYKVIITFVSALLF